MYSFTYLLHVFDVDTLDSIDCVCLLVQGPVHLSECTFANFLLKSQVIQRSEHFAILAQLNVASRLGFAQNQLLEKLVLGELSLVAFVFLECLVLLLEVLVEVL